MTKTSYSEKLRDPRWQKQKNSVLLRDNYTCQSCASTDIELHVHHQIYKGSNPWDTPEDALITYCKHCHFIVEFVKKNENFELLHIFRTAPTMYIAILLCAELDTRIASIFITTSGDAEEIAALFEDEVMKVSKYLSENKING